MIITCPVCSTRYSIDPGSLGASGKTVRCSNCGNTWHQGPVQTPPPPAAIPAGMAAQPAHHHAPPPPPPPQYGYPQYAPPPPPPPGYAPPYGYPPQPGYPQPQPPMGYPPQGAGYPAPPEQPQPYPPQAPARPEPPPAFEPEPESDFGEAAESAMERDQLVPDSIYGMDDEDEADLVDMPEMEDESDLVGLEPELEPEPEPEPMPEAEDEDEESLSDEQLESMFGADAEPEPLESLSAADMDDEDDEFDGVDIDDLPEPEPIPEVFTSPDSRPGKKGRFEEEETGGSGLVGKIIGAVAALLVFGVVAGVFLAREQIVAVWPGASSLYEMIGMGAAEPGEGLVIRDVKSERTLDEGGVDVLIVKGTIANVTDMPRPVPMIRVSLFNATEEEVQAMVVPPVAPEIPPGETLPFAARLKEPAATARRLEVTFTTEGNTAKDKMAPAE